MCIFLFGLLLFMTIFLIYDLGRRGNPLTSGTKSIALLAFFFFFSLISIPPGASTCERLSTLSIWWCVWRDWREPWSERGWKGWQKWRLTVRSCTTTQNDDFWTIFTAEGEAQQLCVTGVVAKNCTVAAHTHTELDQTQAIATMS